MTKRTTKKPRLDYPELDPADQVRTVSFDEVDQMAVDVKTAARLTSLSEWTIREAMVNQELPAYRVRRAVRILVADLQDWLTRIRYRSSLDYEHNMAMDMPPNSHP